VLGSYHFDVTHGAPSPPGYWLYVAFAHALHVVTGLDTVRSLVLLAALASAAAATLTAVAGTLLVDRWVGIAAAVLVASTPVSWFNGSIVSTYSFCALVGVLLVVLARLARPGTGHGIVAVLVLGIATGFMPWVLPMFALQPSPTTCGGGRRRCLDRGVVRSNALGTAGAPRVVDACCSRRAEHFSSRLVCRIQRVGCGDQPRRFRRLQHPVPVAGDRSRCSCGARPGCGAPRHP
jgi:hypothetical protein